MYTTGLTTRTHRDKLKSRSLRMAVSGKDR